MCYFWLCYVLLAVWRLSLVSESGGYFPVGDCGLLIAGASLVAEHRL